MNQIFHKYYTRIPAKYKKDIIVEITRENLYRLLLSMIILAIIESILYVFFKDHTAGTDNIVIFLILYNLLFLPVVAIIYKELDVSSLFGARVAQYLYITGVFLLCCALCLIPQMDYATIDTYIIAIFATSALLYLQPLESFIIYVGVYIAFFIALPHYQSDPAIVFTLRVNALIMNIFACIIGRIVYELKMVSLLDKKTIENKNELLKEMAMRDSMTSLLNHENIYYRLRDQVDIANLMNTPLSLIMLDIDDFKLINDCNGHQVGDKVIVSVANIIIENCRVTDITGRYGGEEFLIIMPGTDLDRAKLTAERIRMLVESTSFEKGIHVTISAGVYQYRGESTEDLIKHVDEFLYRAKNMGRNRIESSALLLG